jgi:hypothetical protein|tara:strand:- start:150 stop:539 length:390 start_codon:yes stop_codon:yes gene_type:complete
MNRNILTKTNLPIDMLYYLAEGNGDFYLNLLESVKHDGIIEPLLVVQSEKGFGVRVGNSRFWAAKRLQLKQCPCLVWSTPQFQPPDGKNISSIEEMEDQFKYPVDIKWTYDGRVHCKPTHFHMGDESWK